MENRELITLGNRNKSISKLKASVHQQNQQTEPCFTSRLPTEPFRLIQKLPAKQNLSSSVHPVSHLPLHHVQVLRENPALTHPNFLGSSPQSRIIESKQKAKSNFFNENTQIQTRQGSPVNQVQVTSRSKIAHTESSKNLLSLTLNQNAKQIQLLSKIKMLEQILSQKDAEHQHIQSIIVIERSENQNLNKRNHMLIKENQECKKRIAELEEMLEREISKSLDLMDNGENFSKEIEDIRADIFVKETLVKTLQEELNLSHQKIASLTGDFKVLKKECSGKVSHLVEELESIKKESDIRTKEFQHKLHSLECELLTVREELMEKEALLLKKDTEHQNELKKIVCEKEFKFNEMSQTISKQVTEIATLQTQIQTQIQAQSKSQSKFFSTQERLEFEDKSECRKCKDLLQTIFKLNSHLNKK